MCERDWHMTKSLLSEGTVLLFHSNVFPKNNLDHFDCPAVRECQRGRETGTEGEGGRYIYRERKECLRCTL